MMLKPPDWGTVPSAVPQRTAGYAPAQVGASVAPSAQSQPVQQTNRVSGGIAASEQPQPTQPAHQVRPKTVQHSAVQAHSNDTPNGNESTFVHRKIWTIGGRNKFIDFTDKLSLAKVEDFANIHGIGGKDHARNSVIGITIFDYTKGTGSNGTRLSCCVDVEDVDQLYEAAKQARLGKLQPDSRLEIQWMNTVQRQIESWTKFPPNQDGSRAIPGAALNSLVGTIANARKTLEPLLGAPYYTYSTEKNNPYAVKNGIAPCYKLLINYSPFQKDGSPSGYPWYIRIETFDAPLSTQKNGASSHKSNQATNLKSAFINLSCDDFWRAMVAVKRYVRVWENIRTERLFAEAEQRLAAQREAWAAKN